MSFASERYSDYSTFFSVIAPWAHYWDKDIHAHTTEELLLLVEEGICTVTCNGDTYQIPTPAFIWNRAGSYHLVTDATVKQRMSYVATFPPKLLEKMPKEQRFHGFMQDKALFALSLSQARLGRLEALFGVLIDCPVPQRPLLLSCIFHQVSLYLKAGAVPVCTSSIDNYIFHVLTILESPGNDRVTTGDLAEQFHVSKAKLEKDFKRCTGHTVHAFRLRVQLQFARFQLVTTDQSLVQIAQANGFTDESHLIRAFQKEYGLTPGAYRRNYRNNPH